MRAEMTGDDIQRADTELRAKHRDVFPATPWNAMRRNCAILPLVAGKGRRIIDIGGGVSVIAGILARLGCDVCVLDNFEYDLGWITATGDDDFAATTSQRREALTSEGVRFIDCDLCDVSLTQWFEPETIDAVVSFHCFEHLHHSPRGLLKSALEVMRPGGVLLLETPNAVNLLKRFKVLAGYTNYASYADYWNAPRFGGHIREYSVGDFHEMATLLGVHDYKVYGRNWFGKLEAIVGHGPAFQLLDGLLQTVPGFCGSLFFEARKPRRSGA
jgi:SAM-dependent methyltransferase